MSASVLVAGLATLVLVLCGGVEAARILLIPMPIGSHFMRFEQIAIPLMARGHELHAYMNNGCSNKLKMSHLGVTVHTYNNPKYGCFLDNETVVNEMMHWDMSGGGFLKTMASLRAFSDMLSEEAQHFLGDEVVMTELAPVGFDLCIVDGESATQYYHIVPYRLNIPVVSHLGNFNPAIAGLPLLPSFTPYIAHSSKFTNEMSFMERVSNSLMYYTYTAYSDYLNPGADASLITKYAPERPSISMAELQRKSKLWLILTDVAIDYPQLRMPHIVDVGGINTRPSTSLPADLQNLADRAMNGIIIVSFGSVISSFPATIKQKLLTVFKQLNHTVIWKLVKTSADIIPENVHVLKWIPQNDLLAHPNTKLFVTHCGANGQFEALYHGVPMLGLPVRADQFYNSLRMAKKGLGVHMDLVKSTPDELVFAMTEMLTNTSYQRTMDMHSAMFKDRAMTPLETAVYWIEHVIKYGSDHLLSPALEFPWYKYYCIDVMLFLILLGFMALSMSYCVWRLMCGCLCSLTQGKLKEQ